MPPSPPPSGEQLTAAQYLRREIPQKSMKGPGWDCLIAALAACEQKAWDNAPLVERQVFLSSASGAWLDRRAGGVGLERPPGVGMPDEAFREYATKTSSRQLTAPAILDVLKTFYGTEAVQAGVSSSPSPFALADGQILALTVDGRWSGSVTVSAADFSDVTAATATELAATLNRQFLAQLAPVVALVDTDPETGNKYLSLRTTTLGARGSLQASAGAVQVSLGLSTSNQRLLDQSRAAYVLARGRNTFEVVLPSTTAVVSRTTDTASYLSTDASTDGTGPYLRSGQADEMTITASASTLAGQQLTAGQSYRLLQVADSSRFSASGGWLLIGYGYEYQSGPVRYLGKAGSQVLVLDPSYVFRRDVPVGAVVNAAAALTEPKGSFWLTDSPAGRVAAAAAVRGLSAAGYQVKETVAYPGDVGLGNAGAPTAGSQTLSDVVQCFAGSEVDVEVAAARSS